MRPLEILTEFSGIYPRFWKRYRAFLESRGKDLPNWPEWCYCPLAAAYAIISGGGSNRCTPEQAGDIGAMGALAAWRVTKGVYEFDPDLLISLLDTPVDGDLPWEVLYRLPEWCVYVPLLVSGVTFGETAIRGFFAHLEWDPADERTELRLLLDTDATLIPVPLHLTGRTLDDAITAAANEATFQRASVSPMTSEHLAHWQEIMGAIKSGLGNILPPIVSVLLYLCTENADILSSDGAGPPSHERRPSRQHAAQQATTWDTGVRIGAALRRGRAASHGAPGTGSHASPRPHVRRAHWHTFFRGPRGHQTPILKWLSPMLIGAEENPVATVRPVHGEKLSHDD